MAATQWRGVDRAVLVMAGLSFLRMIAVGGVALGLLAMAGALRGGALLGLGVVLLTGALGLAVGVVTLARRGS